jgi:hypothetical protein
MAKLEPRAGVDCIRSAEIHGGAMNESQGKRDERNGQKRPNWQSIAVGRFIYCHQAPGRFLPMIP